MLPVFVVIMIAPFCAPEPYNAAAFAPFKIVIDSMLFGSTSYKRLENTVFASNPADWFTELSKGIPSTTINGWLLPEKEVIPLMLILLL